MPDYRKADSFKKDYERLSEEIKQEARKAFKLFQENPGHPSLYIHRLGGQKGIWGGHITEKYVFTFHKETGEDGTLIYKFRRIGDHTIYKKP